MDLNHMLVWTVGAGCFITLLQLLGHKNARQHVITASSILVTLGICLILFPTTAGYLSGTLFFILMLLPAWLNAGLQSLLMRRRYRPARFIAFLISILQPGRDSRNSVKLIHAMELISAGSPDRAISQLKSIPDGTRNGDSALVLRTRLQGSWKEFLEWASLPENRKRVQNDPNLCDVMLQALGESGQRDEAFHQYELLLPTIRKFDESIHHLIRLKLAAFSGDEFLVVQWLSGPLRMLPLELKRFWRATAVQTSGRIEEAAGDFLWLKQNSDPGIALAAERRLNSPLPTVIEFPLTDPKVATLRRLSFQAESEIRQGAIYFPDNRSQWATWTIAITLVLVFLCEIPGGSEDMLNLERMGAMLIPPAPDGSDHWRILTASFLHFGPLHLTMNLLGLIVLGRQIERGWGSMLTLVTYLTAAIGSIGMVPWMITLEGEQEFTLLVGASGGVMGLFGGLLVQGLFNLLRGRSVPAFREFALLLTVVIIQMAFDASTPNVSSEAHLLGMGIGILCGTVWNVVWWIQRRRRAVPSV